MESPGFWSDLRERFLCLKDPNQRLYAIEFEDGTFLLAGGPEDKTERKALHSQFVALAERAAMAAGLAAAGNALDSWFRHLQRGPRYTPLRVTTEQDGSISREMESGSLEAICLSSAEACEVLETVSYAAQHHARTASQSPSVDAREVIQSVPHAAERRPKPNSLLLNRAKWLDRALQTRNWTRRDLERNGGPDVRTLARMFAGMPVKASVLDKLAMALSAKGRVELKDIPDD